MTQQIQKHPIGKWCRRGAWAVALLGALELVWFFLIQPKLLPSAISAAYVIGQVAYVLSVIATTTVFFLILYAISFACDHFLGRAVPQRPTFPQEHAYEVERERL